MLSFSKSVQMAVMKTKVKERAVVLKNIILKLPNHLVIVDKLKRFSSSSH